jgi:3-dehydroquinate dehydratase/shikimate dehydrogenase
MPSLEFPSRVCVALGFSSADELLAAAQREYDEGETFFEFRLDYLADPEAGADAIRKLRRTRPDCRVLATCRRAANHGNFQGSVAEQLRILQAAAEAGARLVDLEIESAAKAGGALDTLRSSASLLLSYHNFEATPALDPILKRMMRFPADAYKVAVTARKPSDVLRALALPKQNPRRWVVALSMGETGFASRVLGPSYGSLFTYAAACDTAGTAPGQASARQLRHLYRIDRLTASARVYGVIADPVRHSISPAVHNRAFQSRRINAVYLPFRVPQAQLRDFMKLADGLPIAGFSVTIPHKQRIIRCLDSVDPLARRIGAVNTVWKRAGKWRGMNADAAGVTVPLSRRLRLGKARVLVAGAGGAARSAAFALADAGASVAITGRSPDRVRALARACGAEALSREQALRRESDVLVHATPLGMFPHVEECFFEDAIPAGIVFDMVYNPLETVLIRRAREQGKTVIPGIEMFLEQAARQFEVWTGESAPRAAMQKAAMEALGG